MARVHLSLEVFSSLGYSGFVVTSSPNLGIALSHGLIFCSLRITFLCLNLVKAKY